MPSENKLFSPLLPCLMALTAVLCAVTHADTSEVPTFDLPIQCKPGENCWVANYADTDPAQGSVVDYSCDRISYDGHRGTDFAIRDLSVMEEGVSVLAAASGTVLRSRKSEPDGLNKALRDRSKRLGRECGNGVAIDHGQGWQTQYCHLKRGSTTVEPGDKVRKGDVIGAVGTSGNTEFPHLHFQVTHNGQVIDPFSGRNLNQGCGKKPGSLWSESTRELLQHRYPVIFNAGFSGSAPNQRDLMRGHYSAPKLACNSPALILWMEAFCGCG